MAEEYKPYYLTLGLTEKNGKIGGPVSELERKRFDFGYFSGYFLGSNGRNWAVIKFHHFSTDKQSIFKDTPQDSLNKALKYLNENGFNATSFDLEGIVDRVE